MTCTIRLPHASVTALSWLARGLIVLGILAIAVFAVVQVESWVYQEIQRVPVAEQAARSSEMPSPEPAGDVQAPVVTRLLRTWIPPDPSVIGEIEVPRLGIRAAIREGIDSTTLRRTVGHVPGTARPGERGNVVLAGHRDTFFSTLRHVERGDTIRVRAGGRQIDYVVDLLVVVGPDEISVMRASQESRLTLVTCFPFGFVGPAPRRFVAGAKAVAE